MGILAATLLRRLPSAASAVVPVAQSAVAAAPHFNTSRREWFISPPIR